MLTELILEAQNSVPSSHGVLCLTLSVFLEQGPELLLLRWLQIVGGLAQDHAYVAADCATVL